MPIPEPSVFILLWSKHREWISINISHDPVNNYHHKSEFWKGRIGVESAKQLYLPDIRAQKKDDKGYTKDKKSVVIESAQEVTMEKRMTRSQRSATRAVNTSEIKKGAWGEKNCLIWIEKKC